MVCASVLRFWILQLEISNSANLQILLPVKSDFLHAPVDQLSDKQRVLGLTIQRIDSPELLDQVPG